MKRRITYIIDAEDAISANGITQKDKDFEVSIHAAKEDRLSTSIEEIARGKDDTARLQVCAITTSRCKLALEAFPRTLRLLTRDSFEPS